MTLGRVAAAEAIGTGLLLAIVVGSGIMGERLRRNLAAERAAFYPRPVSGWSWSGAVRALAAWG